MSITHTWTNIERLFFSFQQTQEKASFPSFVDGKYTSHVVCGFRMLFGGWTIHQAGCFTVPGPCEPEDLIDGIIFAANYLGCTQVLSDKNPTKVIRMAQAQEAVSRMKVEHLIPGIHIPNPVLNACVG